MWDIPNASNCAFRSCACKGLASDLLGNIYLILQHDSKPSTLLKLPADSHRVLQLANSTSKPSSHPSEEPCALAVTPDGQQVFVGLRNGKVLRHKSPFGRAQPQQVAKLKTRVWCMHADDET
jgi:hypothetical protein